MGHGFGPLKKKWRIELFEAQAGLCHWCGERMSFKSVRNNGQPGRIFPTFEHIRPRHKGGHVNSENIALAHYKCNRRKNAEYQSVDVNGQVSIEEKP